jgi:hypothetical protein
MRPWGTWEGTDKGVDHAKQIERRNLCGEKNRTDLESIKVASRSADATDIAQAM